GGEHKVARSYVLYREQRAQERAAKDAKSGKKAKSTASEIRVTFGDGQTAALDRDRLSRVIGGACAGIDGVGSDTVLADTLKNIYNGINEDELATSLILSGSQHLEYETNYGIVDARLLIYKQRYEAFIFLADKEEVYATHAEMTESYPAYLKDYSHRGVAL